VTIDKKRVDALIPEAYKALADVEIAENGKLDKGYRGQIAAFGAAISMGSVLSAVSFFSKKANASDQKREDEGYDRSKLMRAIEILLKVEKDKLFQHAQKPEAKDEILHAAIALKLAMNLYDWGE